MPYPSRKIRRIRACTHQRPHRNEDQYVVSRRPIRRYGVSNLLSNTAYSTQKINTAYPLPLDTAYRSSGTESDLRRTYQSYLIEEVMANMEKKSSMETFAANDKADYYSRITSITVNGKNAYELKGKFLDDLQNNAFSGTNGKDAVEHIEYYLKIIDPIKLPKVDHDKLRVVVFPISFAGGARRWFDGIKEIKESINC
ncbi:hypothetical protein Tco_0704100 [Tanacetum coccineum]|uniref:Uncharacterized protein n=1 Tax=Tanacetum coccineum TaxID=301880 RepID=A0ABQ4Y0R3_9ASTR